ncbi:hypothetical protein TNCV_3802371 [Trichonephila clavipes]|nr:hypothetical protein TNCV_3802371 [Trichonephila clavipes]
MPEMKERVLMRSEAAPSSSTLVVAYETGISQPVNWRFVHEERSHLYHVQRVQSLHTDDHPRKADFVQ